MASIRDYLYTRFENYDKPDEQDFRDLIDLAADNNNISEVIVPDSTGNVVTDINSNVAIPVDVNQIKVIKHGPNTYLFSPKEGDYGLGVYK